MNLIQSVKTCFSKYFDFSGRAARSEYWWFILVFTIINSVLSLLMKNYPSSSISVLQFIIVLLFLFPAIAVQARRLHDINKSGWWQLINIVPIIGVIILIVWFVQAGDAGENRFGAPPIA